MSTQVTNQVIHTDSSNSTQSSSGNSGTEEEVDAINNAVNEQADQEVVEPVNNAHSMTTRLKDGIHKPNPRYALIAFKYITDEPKTIASAMKHPSWNEAVMEEMWRIHMLNTWTLVPPTDDINILDSK